MSSSNLTRVKPPKLYGRDNLLSEVQRKLLAKKTCRILLRGPSGIGKSEFQRGLQSALKRNHEDFVCLHYEVKSSAHSIQDALSDLAVQLLQQIDTPSSRFEDFRAALNQFEFEHTWSLAAAALFDAASVLAPNLKKTVESLLSVIQSASKISSLRSTAERITKTGNDDLLAGFIRLIEALDAKGIHGCILIDRIEAGSQAILSASNALVSNLPPSWGIVITVNDEIPEGLKAIEQLQPQITYVGGEKHRLQPLDLSALEVWTQDIQGEIPAIDALLQVLQNCGGRPLYLRDWVHGLITESETKLILDNRLGDYYDQRLNTLKEDSNWLLRRLAILPENSTFSFEFCHRLLSTRKSSIEPDASWEVILDLISKNFLEREQGTVDNFRLVHAVVRYHIFKQLPQAVVQSAAAAIIETLNVSGSFTENPYQAYTQVVLSSLAGYHEKVKQLALPTASKLVYNGAYTPALQVYDLCLKATFSSDNPELMAQAVIGVATVLLHTGYYQEALARIDVGLAGATSPSLQSQITLLRGEIYMRLNRYSQALEEINKAYANCSELGDVRGQILAEKIVNTILRDLGKYQEAVTQSRALVQRAKNSLEPCPLLASCYQALARSLAFIPNPSEGASAAEQSLEIATASHSIRAEGNAHLAFGEVYRHGGQWDNAITHYEKAIKIAETIANRDSFLWSSLGLADTLLLKGRYNEVEQVLDRIGEIVKNAPVHYPIEHLHWQFSKATVHYLEGDITESELLYAAERYDMLQISWPLRYARRIIEEGKPAIPKTM
jgi:tetratricopeptide (TPR) repeat protein